MPLRFSLRQLEYFVAVGEAGSVALASERINVSSPSISAAIAQLEQEFGIQLFIRRHAQGLSLTPGGRRFFQEARMVLDQAEALHDLASDIADHVHGPINIGCLVTVAPLVVASLRRSFEQEHPNARVSQCAAHQARLLEMLQLAEIDVALTYDLDIPQDIDFEPLAELPPYVMVAAGHPLAARSKVTLEDLQDEPMILLDLPRSREYFLSMFQSRGLKPKIAERTSDLPVLRSLVANGYGYALANIRPSITVAPDGGALEMVALDGDFRPMTLGIAMVRSERRTRLVAAFQEHCRSQITNQHIPGMAPPVR
ncbi:MAG: LysR family transcriptional regulator [Alphaproteobacteria bacterium]|nr:LysR family transcriptional regulator [Alphaproteobacteria bacterium]